MPRKNWTAPLLAALKGSDSVALQKIFNSLSTKLVDIEDSIASISGTSLDGLTDVTITAPYEYQTLTYNGTEWVNDDSAVVSYVHNAEATTLVAGEAVYLYQRTGDRASVKRAYNTSDAGSAKTLGIVAENIAVGGDGPVVTQGYVHDIDLSAFTAGQTLYLGATAGTKTATKPVAPNHLVYLGVAVRANAGNGIMYVRTQNGYELDEIHDVLIASPANDHYIYYDSATSLWKNKAFPTSMTPTAHASMHSSGGTDAITHNNLAGLTTGDPHTQYLNTTRHDALDHTAAADSIALTDLGDVDTTGASNGNYLKYVSAFGGWFDADFVGDHNALDHSAAMDSVVLDDVSDVTITSNASGHYLKWNGSAWVNASLTTDHNAIDHSNALGSAVLADLSNVSSTAPSTNQVLKWNGSAWAPAADTDTTYTAGRGIDLNGTSFRLGVDGARVQKAATQSISNTTFTAMTFTSEEYDSGSYHDNSTNTSRLTVPIAGKYLITGSIEYTANATGVRAAGIRMDGSTYIASQSTASLGSVLATTVNVSIVRDLAANAYVELIAYQSSGGALNTLANSMTHFSITFLGV